MHLIIHFEGKLRRGVDWLTALKVLHPTPAVAGVPSDQAMSTIKEREPFNRNWYAGPMGTIAKNDANIVVAIRSGTVINNQVLLSAGAGIVLESDPNDEWDELDAKINLFATIFSKDAI